MPDWQWSGAVLKEFRRWSWFALVAEILLAKLIDDVFGDFG